MSYEVDRYVLKGIELATEAYLIMAEGEVVEFDEGNVTCPSCNDIPDGCLVRGLFTPVHLERTWGGLSHKNYMEIVGSDCLKNQDEEAKRVLSENEKAYVWWAEHGHQVLQKLAERRNNAVICIRVPESVKKNLEKIANEKNTKITDLLRDQVQNILADNGFKKSNDLNKKQVD